MRRVAEVGCWGSSHRLEQEDADEEVAPEVDHDFEVVAEAREERVARRFFGRVPLALLHRSVRLHGCSRPHKAASDEKFAAAAAETAASSLLGLAMETSTGSILPTGSGAESGGMSFQQRLNNALKIAVYLIVFLIGSILTLKPVRLSQRPRCQPPHMTLLVRTD